MNGSNYLEEAESRPFALCPIDVKKWHLKLSAAKLGPSVNTDLRVRERTLAELFERHGLRVDAALARQRLAALQGLPPPTEPVLVRLASLVAFTRPQLQRLARQHGVRATASNSQLVRALVDVDGELEPADDVADENVPPCANGDQGPLQQLSYRELQARAKASGIRANQSAAALICELSRAACAHGEAVCVAAAAPAAVEVIDVSED